MRWRDDPYSHGLSDCQKKNKRFRVPKSIENMYGAADKRRDFRRGYAWHRPLWKKWHQRWELLRMK
jgi:hypothetical protein